MQPSQRSAPRTDSLSLTMNHNEEVAFALGRIETKLDTALVSLKEHGPRIDKLEKRNMYQTGFTAALGLIGAAALKFLPGLRH
jgi:hypothetical protein